MAKQLLSQKKFAGIAEDEKEGLAGQFFFAQNVNIYLKSSRVSLNPQTIKDSGTTVTNLVKWIVAGTPHDTNTYYYDLGGNIYKRTSAGAWSNLRTVASSDGQGMDVYNDYLYYVQETQVGRYGLLDGTPSFTDNWQTGLNNTTSTKFAPVKAFGVGVAIGHGNQLAWYDASGGEPGTWTLAKLTLSPGFQIRSLDIVDEYLAMTAWKGSTITSSEESYIFYWDGSATNFNFFTKSDEGAINGTVNANNKLFGVIGSAGAIYRLYPDVSEPRVFPKIKQANYMEIYPGAFTNWRNIIHFGVSGATDSTDIVNGVYTLKPIGGDPRNGLAMGYTISTGNSGSTVTIGAVKGIGNQLFIGWKDSSTYGVDRVLQTNSPFASGSIEFLIFDNNAPMMEKLADVMKISHLPLASGESIQNAYAVDRPAAYTNDADGANSTVNDVTTATPIPSTVNRFHEFQGKVILSTSGSTSPTLTGFSLKFDDLITEVSSGKRV